jgi:uncharacterized membrane-anchored protein YjiN (DUF445 family)
MGRARRLGAVSLGVAAAGYAAAEAALRLGWVAGPGWRVAADAFEAATVGGAADWFAVTALFREVPIPILRRHTNIVVKNRHRISGGVADMVQNRWLSPAVIREHLARVSPSAALLEQLEGAERRERLLSVVREVLAGAARALDGPEGAAFLGRSLREQVESLDLHVPLGRWMREGIDRGSHGDAWEALLSALERAAEGEELRRVVHRALSAAVEEYRSQGGVFRSLAMGAAEAFGVLDLDEAAATLAAKIRETVAEAKGNPSHPLRLRLDRVLRDFAARLEEGDPAVLAPFERMKRGLAESPAAAELLRRALSRFRETVEGQLADPASELSILLARFLDDRLAAFRDDPAARERFDAWVRETAIALVEKRHDAIGEMVRGSLGKLADRELVGQIEEKVGDDLQYIRLNGAVVGGFVGAALSVARLFL